MVSVSSKMPIFESENVKTGPIHGEQTTADEILEFALNMRHHLSKGEKMIEIHERGSNKPIIPGESWMDSASRPLACSIEIGRDGKNSIISLGGYDGCDDHLTTSRTLMVLAFYPMNLEQWAILFYRVIPTFKVYMRDMFEKVAINELFVTPPTWDDLVKGRYCPEERPTSPFHPHPRMFFLLSSSPFNCRNADDIFHLLFQQAINGTVPLKKEFLSAYAVNSLRVMFKMVTTLVRDKKLAIGNLNIATQNDMYHKWMMREQLTIDGNQIVGQRICRPFGCNKETWAKFQDYLRKDEDDKRSAQRMSVEAKLKHQADLERVEKTFEEGIAAAKKLAGMFYLHIFIKKLTISSLGGFEPPTSR